MEVMVFCQISDQDGDGRLQNHRDNNITGYFVTNGDGVNDNFDHDPRAKIVLMIPFDNDGCVDANEAMHC
jgi:hypothetical protein